MSNKPNKPTLVAKPAAGTAAPQTPVTDAPQVGTPDTGEVQTTETVTNTEGVDTSTDQGNAAADDTAQDTAAVEQAPEIDVPSVGVASGTAAEVPALVIGAESLGLTFAWSAETLTYLQRVKDSGNRRAFDALHEVDRYCTHCARNHVLSEPDIAKASVRLLRAIVSVVEYGGEEFALTFATLLLMFQENGGDPVKMGALSDYLIYRGMANWSGTDDERKAFNQLIPVLRTIAPVQGRDEALRLLNVNKSLELLFTEAGKARVRSFLDI